jgi:hypothetical protein
LDSLGVDHSVLEVVQGEGAVPGLVCRWFVAEGCVGDGEVVEDVGLVVGGAEVAEEVEGFLEVA